MYQQLWGYKVKEKLYLGVREQERLNTTAPDHDVRWPVQIIKGCVKRLQTCSYESAPHTNSDYVKCFVSFLYVSNRSQIAVWYCVKSDTARRVLDVSFDSSSVCSYWCVNYMCHYGEEICEDVRTCCTHLALLPITNECAKYSLKGTSFLSPEGGVGLVPKRGCLLTLAYYSFPRWYEFGERRWNDILTGENRRTRRKTCPSATLSTINPIWIDPGLRGERPATNDLSHGKAERNILGSTLHI
jgi:hypothetical protein